MEEINPVELVKKSMEAAQKSHASAEKKKLHTLRAGNSGVITPTGAIIGKCARLSALRYHGLGQEEFVFSKLLMFQGGFNNEDWWLKKLEESWSGDIVCEEDIPIQWYTDSGVTVSGRPDQVLTKDGILQLGIEHKKACSLWTVRDVYFQKRPKMPHLCQAFHYMWQLKIPFKLIYTSDAAFYAPAWKNLGWPEPGEPGSEICEYSDKNQIKSVQPMIRSFDLRIVNETLCYRVTGESDWTTTVITVPGLKLYYETVAGLSQSKGSLPARPTNARPDGTKESWSFCGNCKMKNNCDKNELDPETWWKEAET